MGIFFVNIGKSYFLEIKPNHNNRLHIYEYSEY